MVKINLGKSIEQEKRVKNGNLSEEGKEDIGKRAKEWRKDKHQIKK